MKNVPGSHAGIGAQIGGALLAGLAVMGELGHMHHSGPAVFVEHHHDHDPRPHIYFKPGVDSPQDIASRAFDAGVMQESMPVCTVSDLDDRNIR